MINMYSCQVYGDMTADRADDQYPTVAVCQECINEQYALKEKNLIVGVSSSLVTRNDESCHFCDRGVND